MVFGLFSRKKTETDVVQDSQSQLRTPSPSVVEKQGSPSRDPPLTPSPPPEGTPSDSSQLRKLIQTIPPQTLHTYTTSHLREPIDGTTLLSLTKFFSSLAPPPKLHCVRCHKEFFDIENTDRSCKVPHDDESAEVERVSAKAKGKGTLYETNWGCCGKTVEGDGDMGPPDGWCYEGEHTTDLKRARFRADSTLQDDKLVSCERKRCGLPPRSSRPSTRKRNRAITDDGDSDKDEDAQSTASSSHPSTTVTTSPRSSNGNAKRKKPRTSRAMPVVAQKEEEEEEAMDVDETQETPSNAKPPSPEPKANPKPKPKSRAKPKTLVSAPSASASGVIPTTTSTTISTGTATKSSSTAPKTSSPLVLAPPFVSRPSSPDKDKSVHVLMKSKSGVSRSRKDSSSASVTMTGHGTGESTSQSPERTRKDSTASARSRKGSSAKGKTKALWEIVDSSVDAERSEGWNVGV